MLDPIEEHLAYCRQRGNLPTTIAAKRDVLNRVQVMIGTPLMRATVGHFDRWQRERQPVVAPNTWRTEVAHTRRFYQWALAFDHLQQDPSRRLLPGRSDPMLPNPADDELVQQIIADCADPADRLLLLLGFELGMRRAEIAGAKWSDIDTRHRTIRVLGKGKKVRTLRLSPEVLATLELLPHRRGHLVRSRRTGGPLTPDALGARAGALLGPHGLHLHQLRHSALTAAAEESGGDLRLVQEMAGHATLNQTSGYTKVRATRVGELIDKVSTRRWGKAS